MAINFDTALQNAKEQIKSSNKKTKEKDDRFITVTKDESKNGSLIVRFIPDKNLITFVEKNSHFGSHKIGDEKHWFIAECPTTKGDSCPFCEEYLKAWKYKLEDRVQMLKPAKRRTEYISNVYVVKDPGNPDNNGKIMLMKYGYSVRKMIEQSINGDEELGIEPINIFSPFSGANFLLKHSPQGDNITLDGSKFLNPSSLLETDEEAEALLEKTYDLKEYINSIEYESYDALKRKFYKYEHGFYPDDEDETDDTDDTDDTDTAKVEKQTLEVSKEAKVEKAEKAPKPPKEKEPEASDDDDLDDFFNSL